MIETKDEEVETDLKKKNVSSYHMSYDKYYASWKQLATSVPSDNAHKYTQAHNPLKKLFGFGRQKLSDEEIKVIAQR